MAAAAGPVITAGNKSLPLPGEAFKLNGHDAFVILPADAKSDIPWVWYAPTLRGLPAKSEVWMFERFLKAGVAIAGIDVGESYGSPVGREIMPAPPVSGAPQGPRGPRWGPSGGGRSVTMPW